MFLPIGDENPRETTPYVNYALLAANIVAFLAFCFPGPSEATLRDWAMIPVSLDWSDPPSLKTLFTSMFLHVNLLHLGGNMLFLWIFGDNVEDRLGHIPYLLFYLLCGLGADGLHVVATKTPEIPTLGASGAISGVIGAYVLFFPRHRVKMLLIFVFIQVFMVPAWVWIGIWFLEQLVMAAYLSNKGGGGVAYGAHIGGFVAGTALAFAARLTYAGRRSAGSSGSRAIPEELRSASRWGHASRPLFQPLITVQQDPQAEAFRDTAAHSYALLRSSDTLSEVGRIAHAVSQATGEAERAVIRRLDATRGVIAKGITRIQAEKVRQLLRPHEIPSWAVPLGPDSHPPVPLELSRLGWDERAISITGSNQLQSVPWHVPFLWIGAVIAHEPFVDILITPRSSVRVGPRTELRAIDARQRRESRATMRDFAQAIIARYHGAALNDGIRVLAHHGSWGWLNFRTTEDYDDYAFWLYQLILSKQSMGWHSS